MDGFNLFNIGFGELFFIMIFAGLVLGPQRIRQVARLLGTYTAKLQQISRQFRDQLTSELDAADKEDLKAAMDDIRDLRRQVQELRREVLTAPRIVYDEGQQAVNGAKAAVAASAAGVKNGANGTSENTIAPATLPNALEIEDDLE